MYIYIASRAINNIGHVRKRSSEHSPMLYRGELYLLLRRTGTSIPLINPYPMPPSSPISAKFINFPYFRSIYVFDLTRIFDYPYFYHYSFLQHALYWAPLAKDKFRNLALN